MRRMRIAAACVSALCVLGMDALAQTRLEVLSQDVVPGNTGLRMLTIRDNQLSACFTVFVMEPSGPASTEALTPEPTPADDATHQSIDRIRAAAENRGQKLAELKAQFETKTGRPYEQWLNLGSAETFGVLSSSVPIGLLPGVPVGVIPDGIVVGRYELARKAIDDEYEHVLRTEMPGSFPPATLAPGMRTGGFEDPANATRRATLDPDPTSTMKTVLERFGRLDEQLKQLAAAPRMAASGPFPCPVVSPEASKPAR